MATQRANVQYSDRPQPYFSKAAQRPQAMPADNQNAAPGNTNVVQGPWGKAQASYKANNSPVRSAQSTDEIFADSYAQAGMQAANLNRAPDQTRKVNVLYNTEQRAKQLVRSGGAYGVKKLRKQKKLTKVIGVQRLKVTTANAWIGSWAMFWYLTFQMPLAVMSAAGLGMAYTVYITIQGIFGETITDAIFAGVAKIISIAGPTSKAAIEAVAERVFGISFDPILLFFTPFALVFLLGLMQLILTWFVYSAMRINSLSGKAGGIKGLMFILAGVGYAIPILNMFPLIFLWMIVVWMHPK